MVKAMGNPIHRFKKKLCNWNRVWISALCLLLAVVMLISIIPIKSKALSINGEGTGIGSGSAATSQYLITSTSFALGYRFTLVNSLGNRVGNSYDIYDSDFVETYIPSDTPVYRFPTKYSKIELKAIYEGLLTEGFEFDTASGPDAANFYNTYTVSDSSWGLNLAEEAVDMPAWAIEANMSVVLWNAWGKSVDDLEQYGLAVVVEPIYSLQVDGNRMALTVSEIAIVSVADGTAFYDTTDLWDAKTYYGGADAAYRWTCISGYTHGSWPMALYLSEDMFGLSGGSNLKALDQNIRGTAREIVEGGYGIMVVYTDFLADYIVEYDGNGATGGSTASSTHHFNVAQELTPNGYTRTGYTFTGWNYKPDGSGISLSDKMYVKNLIYPPSTSVTLYAQWEPITYTVKYDGNGKTGGSTASSSHTYGTEKALTANGYTKTGYTFVGWNTKADGSGTSYTDKQSVKNLTSSDGETVTLYAQWAPITYTVKYDGNGKTGGSTASSSHTYGTEKALTANGYTKTGYTFKGWNTKADGSGTSYTDKQSVKNLTSSDGETVTLYAQWTPITYTVKYDGNGNTGGSTASSTHTYDTEKALTANGYTKPGYTFVGWNTKADGSGTPYTDKQSVKNLTSTAGDTVTLYAQWTQSSFANQIAHWATGFTEGEGNNTSKDCFLLGSTTFGPINSGLSYIMGADRAMALPHGFSLNDSFATSDISGAYAWYDIGTSVTQKSASASFEYYYMPNSYSISYDLDGGTNNANNPSTYNVLYGVSLEDPTKDGYAFNGWDMSTSIDTVDLTANSNNWNYKSLVTGVEPGRTYTINMSSAQASGTTTEFTTYIYDFTDQKTLVSSTNSFGSDISYSTTCPASADTSHDIRIIVYAGVAGSTSGITASYKDVSISCRNITGINEGCDASFASADDMYAQLKKRFVGNVVLTAKWDSSGDAGPDISAVDRWFTLEEAKTGVITLNELMSTAEAQDSLVGQYTDFAAGEGTFTIVDYNSADFLSFESSGSVTVTYFAKDFAGNTAIKTVKVYITDMDSTGALKEAENGEKIVGSNIRFVSNEYYLDDSGVFLSESEGGFNPKSKWLVNSRHVDLLANVLSNNKNDSGWSNAPVYSFDFTGEEINEIKSFIEAVGPGSSLNNFFDWFLS